MPNTLELRAVAELRTSGRRLEGVVAPFNTEADLGTFNETIRPGAFRWGDDVPCLVDHDPGRLLARTRSGTLRLEQDATSLRFGLDVPNTALGQDVLELASRHDLGGMSVGFRTLDEAWTGRTRELRAVQLVEVSVVHCFPAYAGTSVNVRSRSGLVLARRWLETAT